jgi:Protein of unknown function (DUF3306)
MSEPENFVARWLRRKRETAKPDTKPDATSPAAADPADDNATTLAAPQSAPEFDVTSLPPIDSITADSDIRAFLQSGVPADLTRAALRRVWTTDPAIRDFIGIAENQWDFTDPNAMPGFGPLEPTDDVRALVAQAMGRLPDAAPPPAETAAVPDQPAVRATPPGETGSPQASGMPRQNSKHPERAALVDAQPSEVFAAVQYAPVPEEDPPPANRRSHGRALPQ